MYEMAFDYELRSIVRIDTTYCPVKVSIMSQKTNYLTYITIPDYLSKIIYNLIRTYRTQEKYDIHHNRKQSHNIFNISGFLKVVQQSDMTGK